jgi:eukaryotic-like serine/threonine-protein kinase
LDEALTLARSLQNNALVGKILNFQGERFFYRGDFKTARPLFLQALQVASREKDPGQILTIKINLARTDIMEGHAPVAISSLRTQAKDAETSGMKYLSMECSLYLGEALVASKDYARARQELETTVQRSQSLAMKSLLPQAHYWLALALRGSGKEPEAASHMQQAGLLLEEMRKESHSDALLKREDLRPIAEEVSRKAS